MQFPKASSSIYKEISIYMQYHDICTNYKLQIRNLLKTLNNTIRGIKSLHMTVA